jgi:hypothetical protein
MKSLKFRLQLGIKCLHILLFEMELIYIRVKRAIKAFGIAKRDVYV